MALNRIGVPYGVVGGNAVASWVATVDEGDGKQDACEEERKNCPDRNEAPHGTERGVIQPTERRKPLLTAEQERDARGGDAADHQPRKEDDY